MTVVRGVTPEPHGIADHRLGETPTWRRFTSATIAEEFDGNAAFAVRNKSGRSIAALSHLQDEEEASIPADITLRVLACA